MRQKLKDAKIKAEEEIIFECRLLLSCIKIIYINNVNQDTSHSWGIKQKKSYDEQPL